MLGLRMIGNCEKCFHRSVCEHKKNFETIEQTDEKNCGFYMPIPLLSEDIVLKLLDFNSLYNSSVEVVRCKDCIHWGGVAFGFVCRKLSGIETKICMGQTTFAVTEREKIVENGVLI